MNANITSSELIPATGNFDPAAETSRVPESAKISQTALSAVAGPKSRRVKWLLLPMGLCATIVLVKAALLFGEIFEIVNTVYDRSQT